ncbi:MAG: hypothetical protein AAB354_00400 [candidate division KSB1 bacterium]
MIAHSDFSIAIPPELNYPPRMIHDEKGNIVGTILAYSDYRTFLHIIAQHADWEKLPNYLQDAIDNMLADEAESENGAARPLRELLAESGEAS